MRKIVGKVEAAFEKGGYECREYSGCFDVAARKGKKIVLLKILGNVDSLQESQASSLKIISENLGAMPLVIGENTRKERLRDHRCRVNRRPGKLAQRAKDQFVSALHVRHIGQVRAVG